MAIQALLRLAAPAAAGLALALLAPSASALTNAAGGEIPNSSLADPIAPPSMLQLLADPATPADDPPAAVAALGSPGTPEDDLAAALDQLAATGEPAARVRALAILEGDPIDGKAYSGIPLLNWRQKVKEVPAGGTVVVRTVRFAEHILSDTSLLKFLDPEQPFTIEYRVTELAGAFGGELTPMPLLAEGGNPLGGFRSTVQPLAFGETPTGTKVRSRFTDALGLPPEGAPEHTRAAVQKVEVRMPPPKYVSAILDPSLFPGREALATLVPFTDARAGALPATKPAAIDALAHSSPEWQIWKALQDVDPANVDAMKAAGAGARPLVGEMRTRTRLPSGVAPGSADVTIAFLNNEVYVSRTRLRLEPNRPLTVAVVNRDGFEHAFEARELAAAGSVHDPVELGAFDWGTLLSGSLNKVPAGGTATFTLNQSARASGLWLGDPDHGDQGAAMLELERGPLRQSLAFGPDVAAPLHEVEDSAGNLWVTLAGVDKIARIAPADDLAASTREEYLLPGGAHTPTSPNLPLGPHDILVDGHGILWSTLTLGNGIARIDPSAVRAGTSDGIRVYDLGPCGPTVTCRQEFPPVPGAAPSRGPLQMEGVTDGAGNTVIFFTELNSDHIGALRVAPDGTQLDQVDFPCGCVVPLGLALDDAGSVWFSEGDSNRLGRLTLDQTRPYAVSTVSIDHYPLPSCVQIVDPVHPPPGICTAAPHSVGVDPEGRVWFAGEAASTFGFLDPAQARPGTKDGFTEWPAQKSDFAALGAPGDMGIDGAGRVYWADEYGDVIGTFTKDGPGRTFRPAERRSLTDKPMIDHRGNLWFLELGANLLTRISGVAEPVALPGEPAAIEARTSDDVVSGRRLQDAQSVDVEIVRDGAVATRASGVPVSGGSFDVAASRWDGAPADALRPGDRVRLKPNGRFPRGPLAFTVATLSASVQPDGSVAGQALAGGRPLADVVSVEAGGSSRTAAIQAADGAWRTQPAGLDAASATGAVSWATGIRAGILRTVTRFGPRVAEAAPPADPATVPAGASVREPDASVDRAPGGGARPEPAAGCGPRTWLSDKGRPAVRLIGLRAAELQRCLGRPSRRRSFVEIGRVRRSGRVRRVRTRSERWSYGRTLELTLRRGRVGAYVVLGRGLRSEPRGLGVGSRAAAVRRALPGLRARRGELRGLIPAGRGLADVRFAVSRGRVTRISVAQVGRRPRGVPIVRRAR